MFNIPATVASILMKLLNSGHKKDSQVFIFILSIFTISKIRIQSICSSRNDCIKKLWQYTQVNIKPYKNDIFSWEAKQIVTLNYLAIQNKYMLIKIFNNYNNYRKYSTGNIDSNSSLLITQDKFSGCNDPYQRVKRRG